MIAKRAISLTACAAAFLLTGCLGSGGDIDAPVAKSPYWLNVSAPRAIQADGITISGPNGFCIDPGATQASSDVRFALLGSCASLANSASHGRPRKSAVLSASVGPAGGINVSQNAEALAALMAGPAGRDLMATEPGSVVSVLETSVEDGAVLVHATDAALTAARQLEPGYWRGFFDLKGRVVTLSVFSLPGRQALSENAGEALLLSFIASMRAANAEAPTTESSAES